MTANNPIGVVYISGAGLPAWIWDAVRQDTAHPSIVVDFTALKQSRPLHTISLDEYVATAAQQVAAVPAERIVIVAHSIGGVIGVELAKQLGARCAGIVSICATIPKPGKSFAATMPFPQSLLLPVLLRVAGTTPPESAIRTGLCNDVDASVADKIIADFNAESRRLYTDATSDSAIPSIPSAAIITTADKEYPAALQRQMAARLSGTTTDVQAGHLPMLSQPQRVQQIIQSFMQEIS